MELMNCRNCKKLFNYITGEKLCPACKALMEDKFQEVKRYIEENPRENINQVVEACDVSIRQIKNWVREERLSFTEDSLVGLECERCGKMIHSGRFCKECAGGLAEAMTNAYRRESQTPIRKTATGKMRFLD
ncbi:MAG: flagellar protein [Lachnospiraceae bacterium]|nr:flagellar protein [Lachnospiraceae bacterium]